MTLQEKDLNSVGDQVENQTYNRVLFLGQVGTQVYSQVLNNVRIQLCYQVVAPVLHQVYNKIKKL